MAQPSADVARSQAVEAYRKASKKLSAGKPKSKKPRFGAKEKVTGAAAKRAGGRLAALGGTLKGVDGTDGYTGREIRKIRAARADQKASRGKITTPETPGSLDTFVDLPRLRDQRRVADQRSLKEQVDSRKKKGSGPSHKPQPRRRY